MMKRKKKIRILRILRYRLAHISRLGRGRLLLTNLPLLTYSHLTSPALPRINIILPRINIILPRINIIVPRKNIIVPRKNMIVPQKNKRRAITALTSHHKLQRDKISSNIKLSHSALYRVRHASYQTYHANTYHQHHAGGRKLRMLHQHSIQYHSGQHSAIKQYATQEYVSNRYVKEQNITHENVTHNNINQGNMLSLIKNISAHDGSIKAVTHRLIQQIAPITTQAKQAHQAPSAVKNEMARNTKPKAETAIPQLDYGQIRQMMRDEMAQMARQLQHVIRAETRNDFLETSRIRAQDTQKKGL